MLKFNSALRILVLGCGDSDFLDEGVGPALAEAVGRLDLPGVSVDWCDALSLEDAATLAAHDIVILAGSSFSGAEPFAFKVIRVGAAKPGIGRQSMKPAELLYVTSKLYGRKPEAWQLAIRAYDFGPGQGLSERARAHVSKAVEFLEAAIRLKLAA